MSEALAALRWAVAVGLVLLAALTSVDWLRHRDRSRRYLALAVGALAVLGILGPLPQPAGTAQLALSAASIALFMASALALVLFRHSLIPMALRWLRASMAAALMVAVAGISVTVASTGAASSDLVMTVDIMLLLTWCALVAMSIESLWRRSASLPGVQRARLRALNLGFGGIIVALLGMVVATASATDPELQLAIEAMVLVSLPWLGVSLSPPGWLRRNWREREEIHLRHAMNNLLLYSPDETTLGARALEWAARLLGGGAAMVALEGRILAVSGINPVESERLHSQLASLTPAASVSFPSLLGPTAVVPLHAQSGEGYLAILAGPFTPLFGDEELGRLSEYGVSITLALDRVQLVTRMRRNAELLDLAYDAIFSWDFDSRVVEYWNLTASELYGYARSEAVGEDPQALLHTQYPVALEAILTALRRDGRWEGELLQQTKDGRILSISARWALQRDAAGSPVSVLEINRDISQEKRAAQELRVARDAAEHASTAKSAYLSRMSHELRTPLAAMLGFSDLLEMREPRPDQLHAVEAIQRAGAHLLGLVNDVLDIARIEAGHELLALRPLEVRALLEECVGLVGQSAGQRGITMSMRRHRDNGIFVRADRQRLIQVLLNLLSNAVKYGAEGGRVITGAAVRDGTVEIEVTDDGRGLSAEQQERLFQPFERLGAERSLVPGTGLGLALARQLTVAMGGSLRVRSAPGEGATFTVCLQRAAETDGEALVPAAVRPVLGDRSSLRTVLYVEDSLATIAVVESTFALRPNIRLLTAMQGGIAIDLAREHRPDLIILDLHLPDLDGDEVIARLRKDPVTSQIPVVMYSADATQPQVDRLLAAGAVAYLTKPARVAEFLATVDRVLGNPASLRPTA